MSIKYKFTLLIIVFIIILGSILTFLSINRQEQLLLESNNKRLKVLMLNASDTIKEGLISADDLLISSTIRKIKQRNEDIINTYLLDHTGTLIFHSDIQIMNEILNMGHLKKYTDSLSIKALKNNIFLKQKKSNNYLYSYPVFDNNIRIGTLFINYSFERVLKKINQGKIRLIFIAVTILIFCIISTYLFTTILLRPVKKLSHGATIIGKGDLDYKIDVTQKDELGSLAESFNQMTAELKTSRQKLIEKELLEKDLEIASEIQGFLIPETIPQIPKIEICPYYNPAHSVGGDYYDIIEIGPQKYGIIIVDVSGKGSGAAIIMAVITFIFHSEAFKNYNAQQLISVLNSKLIDRIPHERFATGIYIIYDAEKETIQYCNAGHSQLVVYKHANNKIYQLQKATALPLGITKDVEYEQASFKMEKGDGIILFTDGIYEAMNKNREDYTLERTTKTFHNYISQYSPEETNKRIIKDINKFTGDAPQHDDMTLITIKKIK